MNDSTPEPTKELPLLIWDCDPGCDDALGIALLVKKQLEKKLYDKINFFSVAGNVAVEQTTFNAARVLIACLWENNNTKEVLRDKAESFKIYRGCNRSMDGEEPSAASVHGRDGLGDAPNRLIWAGKEFSDGEPQADNIVKDLLDKLIDEKSTAVEEYLKLSRMIISSNNQFDLLCTGPLTNIGTAILQMRLDQQRSFWSNCRSVVIMGGSFNSSGNITHSAEFNTFADPVATQVVLDSFNDWLNFKEEHETKRIHFVSLDTTEFVAIPLDSTKKKDNPSKSPAANFILYSLKQYGLFHVFHCTRPKDLITSGILKKFDPVAYANSQLSGGSGDSELKRFCYLHDPLAAWVLLDNNISENALWKKNFIRIDTSRGEGRGRIIICAEKKNNPTPIPIYGTQVKWLSPEGFDENIRHAFIMKIAALLGIDDKDWKSASTIPPA